MSKKATDIELTDALFSNSKVAFEEIYTRYWYSLFSMAYHHLNSKEEAEELVHDLFESVWQNRSKTKINKLEMYLRLAMKNLISNYIRSQITWRKYQEYLIFQNIQKNYTPAEILNYNDLKNALEQVLDELPTKTSDIFNLSRFEGFKVKEIAQKYKISEKTVEYHLAKTQQAINKRLLKLYSDN